MLRLALAIFFICSLGVEKEYHKEFYDNGKIKSQGWKKADSKEAYWKYYHPNGKLMEQGHYLSLIHI